MCGVRKVALNHLTSFEMGVPLLSVMGDGLGRGDRVTYYISHLSMDMALSPKTGILSNSVFTKTEKAICFASVKEPVTAYSNRLPGTVYF